ncbi:hypothetical protein MTQ10_11235 [Streptomyces sp. XM83C]|jgi:hypothetical protein|uniref:Uncharacterized protein n=1 Tax=Streptomyces thermocoprophilus TaxID=78356 RepID=A0ABV5V9I6_9ACTN|nr:hypothetical protein [Streptomyces sp. XM83C]MCK1820178.1 hypothetical protein [Streptomyces sp. XM83C]
MTDTPPPMPTVPPMIPRPPHRSRTNAVIVAAAAAVVAAVVITGIVVVQATDNGTDSGKPMATTPAIASATATTEALTTEDHSTPEPSHAAVDEDDFSIELRTTERHCFGSAGCNVTVEPELTYLGLTSELDPDATYEITYEILGDESGPIIETAELTDRTSLTYHQTSVSTDSSSTTVSVEITEVMTR